MKITFFLLIVITILSPACGGTSNQKPGMIFQEGNIKLFDMPKYSIGKSLTGEKCILIIGIAETLDKTSAKEFARVNAAAELASAIAGVYKKQIQTISKRNPNTGIVSYRTFIIERFYARNVNVSGLEMQSAAYRVYLIKKNNKLIEYYHWISLFSYPYSEYIMR